MLAGAASSCRASLGLSGERHMHCNWMFPYRAPAARTAFENLTRELTECLGPEAEMTTDQSVNHPDAYQLFQFDLLGREFAVSIKDKGALQQTHVFVRVEILP